MPRLSSSMVQGTIIRWLRHDGELVSAGDELVEVETDKATMSVESEHSGVLTIVAPDGETLAVGALIAHVAADSAGSARPGRARGQGDDGRNGAARGPRVNASPVARRLASQLGVALEGLSGTGPGGRVVKADVERAAQQGVDSEAEQRTARVAEQGAARVVKPSAAADDREPTGRPAASVARGEVTIEALTSVQSTIATRMTESKATMPDFTLTTEAEMDAALELRSRLAELELNELPSINDLVLRACAIALRAHPRVNASYVDGAIEVFGRVNIAVAVAAPGALLVPVIANADTKPLAELAAETRALSERARTGSLTPAEVSGATFTISNLGMYGITQFSAILNPPQAAILAVGAIREQVALADGELVLRRRMSLTLTCDHRILYGADAAVFLQSIQTTLEQPVKLLV
jgi:pyruvate dehydrogenase E2 component (dihydrolipoamide acetyltransferase)